MRAGRILAIDHGTKRSGTALSDRNRVFAFPGEAYPAETDLLAAVERLAASEDLACIVVGLPLNMDGSCGDRAREVLGFCERLRSRVAVDVVTWDERLTTYEAETLLREALGRGRPRKDLVNAVAAQRILQSYLASLDRP